jgi:N6-L-threonylcarbamoyladenine synthase
MLVLGIETSCDETGVALYDTQQGLIAQRVYSQIALHAPFGGVVPELASRDHLEKALPLIQQLLADAQVSLSQLNGIAFTQGPGLMGALFVGAMLGRSLAMALGIPAVGVHHMEGHLLAPLLMPDAPSFPFVGLLVSGGHTQLLLAKAVGDYQLLGETVDDAAGEAFDKVASMLGLPYPGGPELAALAATCAQCDWKFPRPMVDRPGLDFSFSGLKTHCRVWIERLRAENNWNDKTREATAYAFEQAVVDTLRIKCVRALEQTGVKNLVVAGGVGANQQLRQQLTQHLTAKGARVYYPPFDLCTDNGAMIAFVGALRLQAGQSIELGFNVKPRWSLEDLDVLAIN